MNFRVEVAAITSHYPMAPLFRTDFNNPNFDPLVSNSSYTSSNAVPIDPFATWTEVDSIPNSPERQPIIYTGCLDGHLEGI